MNLRDLGIYRDSPQPQAAPSGSGRRHVMLAALFGAGVADDRADAEYDAYARFLQRSLAMGWMSDGHGLWQINDASTASAGASDRPVAWYQVDVADEATHGVPLPVQPFLRCAVESTGRDRSADLDAIQILLPVGAIARPGIEREPLASMYSVRWFQPADAGNASTVGVRVDFSRNETGSEVGTGFFDLAQRVNPPGFEISDVPPPVPPMLQPPFGAHFWNGPTDTPLDFTAVLPMWDTDALGWFAAFIGDVLARVGVSETVLLTIVEQK